MISGILRLFGVALPRGHSSRVGLRLKESPPSQPILKELQDRERFHAAVFVDDGFGSGLRLGITPGPEADLYPRVVGIGLSSEVCSHDHRKVEETPHGCPRKPQALCTLYSPTSSPNYGGQYSYSPTEPNARKLYVQKTLRQS